MSEKKKPTRITTRAGEFIWPRLFEPDTKYDPAGLFSVKFKADAAEASRLMKLLEADYEAALEQGREKFAELPVASRKKLKALTEAPIATPVYDDNEEETGEYLFNFKMKHEVTSKKSGETFKKYPAVFDAKGRPIKKAEVGSGTVGKVTFEAAPYFNASAGQAGLSLRLSAVQIIDLVAYGQRSASAYGFEEEDGYTHDEDEDEASTTNTNASAEDDGEADF